MIKIDQKYLAGGEIPGDCVRACVCSILELPIEQVPHFVRWAGQDWANALVEWCEKHEIFADWHNGVSSDHVPYMLCGPSPRNGRHAVVAQNGLIIHDPHPSRAGLRFERRENPFYFRSWIFKR